MVLVDTVHYSKEWYWWTLTVLCVMLYGMVLLDTVYSVVWNSLFGNWLCSREWSFWTLCAM